MMRSIWNEVSDLIYDLYFGFQSQKSNFWLILLFPFDNDAQDPFSKVLGLAV